MPSPDTATDHAVLAALGEQLARRRLQQNLTQASLAREAGVSLSTVVRLERGASTQLTNLVRVLRVLDLLANLRALVPPPLPSPLEQLRTHAKERRRASRRRRRDRDRDRDHDRARGARSGGAPDWAWGDERPRPPAGSS